MDNNPIHEAMLAYWGERCPDHHQECVCCQAWEHYDGKKAAQPAQDAMQSLKDLKRSVCDEVGKAAFAQPVQELVKYKCTVIDDQHPQGIPLEQWGNTGKAQRPWVYLTDEEAQWLYDNCRTPSSLIDMVEAKLREKNNGR